MAHIEESGSGQQLDIEEGALTFDEAMSLTQIERMNEPGLPNVLVTRN